MLEIEQSAVVYPPIVALMLPSVSISDGNVLPSSAVCLICITSTRVTFKDYGSCNQGIHKLKCITVQQ